MESPSQPHWSPQRRTTPLSSNQQSGLCHDLAGALKSVHGDAAVQSVVSPEMDAVNASGSDGDEKRLDQEVSRQTLQKRCSQLQDDVEVLAAHLEQQAIDREREREEDERRRLALEQANAALVHELRGLCVEKDALQKQNVKLARQQEESVQLVAALRDTHEELLHALAQQQTRCEELQSSAVCGAQERAQSRQALDRAQMHCRRLEEELASAHTQVLHLQSERDTLQAALAATAAGTTSHEARQVAQKDEEIRSLRADLLQMEFEFKTLTVAKAELETKTKTLQRRLTRAERGTKYEVVSLGGSSSPDGPDKAHTPKKRTTIRPVRSKAGDAGRRGSDLFCNLMELPNAVHDASEGSKASCWLPQAASSYFSSPGKDAEAQQQWSLRERVTPPPGLVSLVAKTVQSARKRLTAPLQSAFVAPQ